MDQILPRTVLALWLLLVAGRTAHSGDWPQILGPQRDAVATASKLTIQKWDQSGPRLLWERPVGEGVAGVAVSEESGILFHRVGDDEVVERFDPSTGKVIWKDAYPTTFRPQVGGEAGPLCVPAISGNHVVTFGAQGVLSCYDLQSGKRLWRRKTHDDFDAREGYFGAGSSPLISEDRVIVNVGGFRSDAGVVAFKLADGETLWHVFNDHASYSSPRMVEIDGKPRVVVECRLTCLGLDPADGRVVFQFPFGSRGPTVNGANPVMVSGKLFLSASYGIGAMLVSVDGDEPQTLWSGDDLYSSQYCTPAVDGDVLYGVDGRQDGPPGDLKCFDPLQQRILWTAPGFGYGTLILADGKLLILRTDGTLVLATANRERFDPLCSAQVLRGTARALPALADGRLFVRDETTLRCFQLGATSPGQD
ncbi:MAG: PQQ-binding-like beta-propeller repeat protein [Planctomycetaceae bacterium]|nr:PQQ-binding-like beta-propeller repeat protein [Planctomycetaceae bacterium]